MRPLGDRSTSCCVRRCSLPWSPEPKPFPSRSVATITHCILRAAAGSGKERADALSLFTATPARLHLKRAYLCHIKPGWLGELDVKALQVLLLVLPLAVVHLLHTRGGRINEAEVRPRSRITYQDDPLDALAQDSPQGLVPDATGTVPQLHLDLLPQHDALDLLNPVRHAGRAGQVARSAPVSKTRGPTRRRAQWPARPLSQATNTFLTSITIADNRIWRTCSPLSDGIPQS